MHLLPEQIQTIKDTVKQLVGPFSRVWLFGPRVVNALRGGDIDLLVETDEIDTNRIKTLSKIESALVMALGDRKLDVLLKDVQVPDVPAFEVARRQGILL